MAFWGIQVKPGKPFTLKFDDGVRRRLHISQATLAIGPSKQTSLVQCNVGDKSPVLLCALLPDKNESLQLNLEFDEDEEVLFSVIGPRAVHLTGFYTGVGRNFNDDDSESYGEDIANSENEEFVAQSDEDEYEDSFIDDDDNLEVLPPSPESTDGVDGDVGKKRNKKNTNKRLKKRSRVIESDDESISWKQNTGSCIRSIAVDGDVGKKRNKINTNKRLKNRVVESDDESISWKQNTGSCIRSVYVSDSEDGFPISSVRKNQKPAKKVSESNACGDASNLMVDGPVRNDDPKRTMPKKKSKGAGNKGNTFEADPANHSNEGDEIKQSEEKTIDIAFGQDPVVTNEIDNDPGMNMTVQKENGKGTSIEEKFFEADAADHSNPDDKAKKSESKTNDIAVYQDPIVGNEICVDPGTNKTTPKKKGKGVCHEVQILEADSADHSNLDHKAKKSEANTSAIAINQDPIVTNEIDGDPVTDKWRSNLLPSSELGLESGAKPKKKRKERSKEEIIPEANTDNHLKSFKEKNYLQADTGADDMDQDLHVGKENVRRLSNKTETGSSAASLLRTVEEGSDKPKKKRRKREQEQNTPAESDLVVPERKADENTSEKAAKKKKQKSKVQKNDDNMDVPVLLNGEKENSINEVKDENVISGSSQVRTLSNGLVIEDLESSKSNGKAAALGLKLKVQYTAKLKENGEIVDSNGKAPYRFRLGDEDVMEGWKIGLEGMRAGDKRRLVVPPSLGNGSRGTAENVPPDSWVIYDVELLSVR